MSAVKGTVIVMAGGTGGHVFPALAVADFLKEEGFNIVWLGTPYGLEATVVPEHGYPLEEINIRGVRRSGLLRMVTAPLTILRATMQAIAVMKRHKPVVVIGLGGFVTGPGGLAAWIKGCPLVIHEQNAVPGLTNRLLSRIAKRVLEGFAGAFSSNSMQTGNPVRASIMQLTPPEQRYADRKGKLRLLVVGGSLGAAVFNSVVPAALAQLPEDQRPEVWHQAGKKNLDTAQENYRNAGVDGRVDPFVADMAEAYQWADIIVCRAGALTVAEIAAVGVASVLVPYPYAVDDHQTKNACYLSEQEAALLVPQTELSAERLAELIAGYSADNEKGRIALQTMAVKARALAKPEATRDVARQCVEVAHV